VKLELPDRFYTLTSTAWRMSIWVLIIAIVITWISYLLVGQQVIATLYNSQDSWIAGKFMAGRASTPIDAYYRRADAVLVHGTLWLIVAYITVRLLMRNPRGVFLSVFSFLVSSFLLFVCSKPFLL
jgi:hypothetical protein